MMNAMAAGVPAPTMSSKKLIGKAVPEEAGGTAQALYSTIAAGVMQGGAQIVDPLGRGDAEPPNFGAL